MNIKESRDQLSLSEVGKRLRFRGAAVSAWQAASGTKDASLRLMEDSISEAGGILEKMKALTLAASDESLTDMERVNMQMEMEDLRSELSDTVRNMVEEHHGEEKTRNVRLTDRSPEEGKAEFHTIGDGSSLLERARDRIAKGQNWNVREAAQIVGELKEIRQGETGWQPIDGEIPEGFDPDDFSMKLWEPKEGRWVVTDDTSVPTVREILEQSGSIVLMDAKSAAEGTERLDREINALRNMRDEFVKFAQSKAHEGAGTPGGNMSMRRDSPSEQMFSKVSALLQSTVGAVAAEVITETPYKLLIDPIEERFAERYLEMSA